MDAVCSGAWRVQLRRLRAKTPLLKGVSEQSTQQCGMGQLEKVVGQIQGPEKRAPFLYGWKWVELTHALADPPLPRPATTSHAGLNFALMTQGSSPSGAAH